METLIVIMIIPRSARAFIVRVELPSDPIVAPGKQFCILGIASSFSQKKATQHLLVARGGSSSEYYTACKQSQ